MVIRKKKRTKNDDEYFEEEYESSFNKASNNSDKSLLFMGGLAGTLGLTSVINSLSTSELSLLKGVTSTETPTVGIDGFSAFNDFLPSEALQSLEDIIGISESDLNHYNQMMEDARQYGRMSDPKTAENIEFSNQSSIAEKIGQFGYHESSVQGNLQMAAGEGIMFPWTTCEDNGNCSTDGPVCDDCNDLRDGGPYPADNYPEPPHYFDRCNEPFPDPIIAMDGDQFGDNLPAETEDNLPAETEETTSTTEEEEPKTLEDLENYILDENGNPMNYETALSLYQQGGAEGAEGLNFSLRYPTDVGLSEYEEAMVKQLDEGMDTLKVVDHDRIIYRGCGEEVGEIFTELGVGGTFSDPAYLSTSVDKSVADWFSKGGWKLEIEIPAGSEVNGSVVSRDLANADIPLLSRGEKEILLARDTEFSIESISEETKEAVLRFIK